MAFRAARRAGVPAECRIVGLAILLVMSSCARSADRPARDAHEPGGLERAAMGVMMCDPCCGVMMHLLNVGKHREADSPGLRHRREPAAPHIPCEPADHGPRHPAPGAGSQVESTEAPHKKMI